MSDHVKLKMLSCGAAEGLVSKIEINSCVDVFAPKAIKGNDRPSLLWPTVMGTIQSVATGSASATLPGKFRAPEKGPASLTTAGPFYADLLPIQ
jgi:hypothetical protein